MYMGSDIYNEDDNNAVDPGVFLSKLGVGKALLVQTRNTLYRLERREDGWYISGHARYCPEPTLAWIAGSTWGGSMLKVGFVGRGMHLEFSTKEHQGTITTSTIQDVKEAL